MKRTFAALALVISLGFTPEVWALTRVPRDYPNTDNQATTTINDLPSTIAIYRNDVVLLATNPESHEVQAKKLTVDPAVVRAIRAKAGNPPTLESLIAALQDFIRTNPNSAIPATVAAFQIAQEARLNGTSPVSLVLAAIQSLDGRTPTYVEDIAALIGFGVAATPVEQRYDVLRQLRALAISQNLNAGRVDFTVSLDQALVQYHVAETKNGSEELLLAVNDFLPDSSEGDISEDSFDLKYALNRAQWGVFNEEGGANLISPFGESGVSKTFDGGSPINGNPAVQTLTGGPTPTPTPTPTPVPPSPTPTPAPTPTPPS